MSLKCSLLGCDYTEPERVEERTERENEVVVTTREVQQCVRCGNEQVVSENKEVTAIEDTRETTPEEPDAPAPGAGVGDPWESVDSDPDASEHIESVGGTPDPPDPGADDGIIMEDSDPDADPEVPDEPQGPADAEAASEADDDGPETAWADAAASRRPVERTVYVCPECGFEAEEGTSLRPGDVCPECHGGYLGERTVERNE
jgi:predicted  nucleic acid-binding Zn-ribbon protein